MRSEDTCSQVPSTGTSASLAESRNDLGWHALDGAAGVGMIPGETCSPDACPS